MRRLSLFICSLLFSTALWAMHCPADMAKIDEILKNDPRVETVLLPIRDGLTMSRVI